ncbi:MAG: hypothetical protein LBL08_02430 [Candidatus Nomurabacteria bacterium]|jgi:cell division septal protein FtsQ|nr:hypothetical protein [Candidatus Nomurabacteria bacterium]
MRRRSSGQVRRRAGTMTDSGGRDFVRGQTVNGYNPEGNGEKNVEFERVKEIKKASRKKRSSIILGTILVIVALAAFVVSQYTASVDDVRYSDDVKAKSDVNEGFIKAANAYLSEHPSERFAWSFRKKLFTNYLTKQFPEIASADISSNLIGGGVVDVKIRKPVAVWRVGDKSYYVDSGGNIFQKNYHAEPSITISDGSGIGNEEASTSRRLLEFIGKVISGVEKSGVGKVVNANIPASAIRYVEINIAGRAYPIKVQTDREADEQVADIVAMLKYLDQKKIKPKYVDLRVKNRGYWR